MRRNYLDYIEDIINSIEEVESFTSGMSFDDFVKDKKTINAVIRSFEVIGEAAKIIPEDFKKVVLRFHGNAWQECGTN